MYLKLEGGGPLLAGHLPPAYQRGLLDSAVRAREGAAPVTDKLVVPEGSRSTRSRPPSAASRGSGSPPMRSSRPPPSGQVRSPYEPAGTNNLEGLLFPATYPVQPR